MHHLYQICKSGHILELLKEKLIFKLFTIQVSVKMSIKAHQNLTQMVLLLIETLWEG